MRIFCLSVVVFCALAVGAQQGAGPQRGVPPSGQGAGARGQPQSQPAASLPKATLRGHVYSTESGRPLKNAELTLRADRGRSGQPSTLTDSQGAFEFREVEPGSYYLECARSGYITASYGQKDPRSPPSPFTVSPAQEVKDLDFLLSRGGVISGTVLDEDGEPLTGVEVSAYVRRYNGRRPTYAPVSSVATDDRGCYRIYELSPGRYYVLASFRRDAERADGYHYRPTIFPNGVAPEEAQRIEVSNGADIPSIDFRLQPVPTFTLAGRVFDSLTGQAAAGTRIALSISDIGRGGGSATTRPDGSFAIRSLFPGRYRLTINQQGGPGGGGMIAGMIGDAVAGAAGRGGGPAGRGNAGMTVKMFDMPANDVRDFVAALDHPVSVRGRIVVEGGQLAARGSRISLSPRTELTFGGSAAQVNDDLTFEIQNVPTGEYNVNVTSRGAGGDPAAVFYVREVRVNSQDVSQKGLAIGGAPTLIEVVLDFNGGTVSGRILNEKDETVAGSAVLMSADEQKRADDRYSRTTNTAQDGQFSFKGVVPGDYLLLAWPDSEVGRVYDPEVFAQVEKYATRVHVEQRGSAGQEIHMLAEVRLVAQNAR